MWLYVNDKSNKMWPSKHDKTNIYEFLIHILKKETFDFRMLNVTVSLC